MSDNMLDLLNWTVSPVLKSTKSCRSESWMEIKSSAAGKFLSHTPFLCGLLRRRVGGYQFARQQLERGIVTLIPADLGPRVQRVYGWRAACLSLLPHSFFDMTLLAKQFISQTEEKPGCPRPFHRRESSSPGPKQPRSSSIYVLIVAANVLCSVKL